MNELNKAEKPVKPVKRSKAKFIYLGSVAVIALVAGGVVYGKEALEQVIVKQIEQRGVQASSVNVDYFGRLHLRDVVVQLKDGRQVQFETVSGRPKILFMNGYIDAANVVADLGAVNIKAPRILVEDANLDEAGIRAVLGGSKGKSIAERVEQMSAGLISIPEMSLVQKSGPISQEVNYKGLRLEKLNKGIVKKINVASAKATMTAVTVFDAENKESVTDASLGEMSIDNLNLAFLARLYSEKANPDSNAPQLVHGPFSIKNITMQNKVNGVAQAEFSYDEVNSTGMTAHLLQTPLLELANQMKTVQNAEKLTPTEQVALAQQFIDVAGMIDTGDLQLKGLDAKILPDLDAAGLSIGSLGIQFADNGIDFNINDFSLHKDEGDKVELGSFEVDQFSWQPSLQAFAKLEALKSDDEIKNFPFYSLLPDFGTWRLSDLDVDVKTPQADITTIDEEQLAENGEVTEDSVTEGELTSERITFKLKEYELKASKPVNGIPSSFRGAMNGLTIKLAENMSDIAYQQLHALGYDTITFSSVTDAEWDQDNQQLLIREISMNGEDMGSFSMSGVIGGFKKDFFSGDKVLTQVALLGLTARELNVNMVDHGFIGRWIDHQAEDQGMSAEELRKLIAATAENSLQLAVGEQPKLQPVIAAFTKFLSKPGSFDLKLKAKSEKGLGMFDFMTASQDPDRFIEKIDITVKAD